MEPGEKVAVFIVGLGAVAAVLALGVSWLRGRFSNRGRHLPHEPSVSLEEASGPDLPPRP